MFEEDGLSGPELDWDAYYEAFKDLHGKEPVPHRGLLLFPDGWRYSSSDPAGPEWSAPTDPDELRKLQLAYWKIRERLVRVEAKNLALMIEDLRKVQESKSAPLQYSATVADPYDEGKVTTQTVALDLTLFQDRLRLLNDDLRSCGENVLKYTRDGDRT